MKLRLLAFALLFCGAAMAQNPYIAIQGASEGADGLVVSHPRTVLAVDVTVERDMTLAGPYARYAQKYLGVRAALTDKTTWTMTGASVLLARGGSDLYASPPAEQSSSTYSYTSSDEEFARLQPDKNDLSVPTLDDAAAKAAEQIFALRRHRLELITGEAGENVFGEGLEAALAEIARLEQSYLELFLGKRVLTTQTDRYLVYPRADKKQYVVCRFSGTAGLLPDSDLSGEMVFVQITPSGEMPVSDIEASSRDNSVAQCRMADLSTCTVSSAGREYARKVLPVFEFGRTINVALPRRK